MATTAVGLGISGMLLRIIRMNEKDLVKRRALINEVYSKVSWLRVNPDGSIDPVWIDGGVLDGKKAINSARSNIFTSTARIVKALNLPMPPRFQRYLDTNGNGAQSGTEGESSGEANPRDVPGKPDFFYLEAKVAIFVDGCYWHGCPQCMAGRVRKTNSTFWTAKIQRTQERDLEKRHVLEAEGIYVLRFWEHELKNNLPFCIGQVEQCLSERAEVIEWDEDGLRSVYD